jgi:hypothetical protein
MEEVLIWFLKRWLIKIMRLMIFTLLPLYPWGKSPRACLDDTEK